jgi:hypothetical protein
MPTEEDRRIALHVPVTFFTVTAMEISKFKKLCASPDGEMSAAPRKLFFGGRTLGSGSSFSRQLPLFQTLLGTGWSKAKREAQRHFRQ